MTNEPTGSRFKIRYGITSAIGRVSIFIIFFCLVFLRLALHWADLVLGAKFMFVFFALCPIAFELDFQLFMVRAIGLSKQGVVLYDWIGATPPVRYDQVFRMEHAINISGVEFNDKQVKNFPELVAILPQEVLEEPHESHPAEEEPRKNRWGWLKWLGVFAFIVVSSLLKTHGYTQWSGWLGASIPFSMFCYQVYDIASSLLERRKANRAGTLPTLP